MCTRIVLDETEGDACLVNVFEASLARKDVSRLQLPPLLLAPQDCSDPFLAGDFRHCKEHLSVQMGGILLRLQQDLAISKCAVVAWGAVVSALTGCAAGDVDRFVRGSAGRRRGRDPRKYLRHLDESVQRASGRRGAVAGHAVCRCDYALQAKRSTDSDRPEHLPNSRYSDFPSFSFAYTFEVVCACDSETTDGLQRSSVKNVIYVRKHRPWRSPMSRTIDRLDLKMAETVFADNEPNS